MSKIDKGTVYVNQHGKYLLWDIFHTHAGEHIRINWVESINEASYSNWLPSQVQKRYPMIYA